MKRSKVFLVCAVTLLLGIAHPAIGAPANDDCQNAQAVGNVTNLAFNTTTATFDGPGHYMESQNIWYVYTAQQTCDVIISLCGSSFDTKLAVYEGNICYPAESALISSNDDSCDRQSSLTFTATFGQQYLIEVGGYRITDFGQGVLSISCDVPDPGTLTNDNCGFATPVGNVTNLAFDTTSATFDGPGYFITSPNIWYCYTATCTGQVTVNLCGSRYDTKLAVYSGCGCYPDPEDVVGTNDDDCASQSRLTFDAVAGEQFLIEIGGFGSRTGEGVMSIRCDTGGPSPPPCQPTNDNCANAKPIGNATNLPFDTTCATFDGPGLYITSPNIWYCYTATCTGQVTVSLCGSSFNTRLAVYNGCACNPTAGRIVKTNNNACGFQSRVTFNATAGQQFLIEVGGNGSLTGQGIINVNCQPSGPPPVSNDNCANAQPVGNVTNLAFNTTTATFDGPGLYMTSPNIWYCYTATCTGQVTVSLCGSSFDTKLAVYNGCTCNPTAGRIVKTNNNACGFQSRVTFSAIAGQQFLIEVGGNGNSKGQGVLSINCAGQGPPPVSNDNCWNATSVGNVTNLAFNTTSATFDGPGLYMTSPNIWYCYTATCTGQVTVSLCGSSFDTKLAVYSGCACYPTAGRIVKTSNNACGFQSRVTFNATAGQRFLIEVGGTANNKGQGVLNINCAGQGPPPVSNDNCANATPVGNVTNLAFDTTAATFDGPGLYIISPNIWYCYTATCTGQVTVSLCGSSFDTKLAVYNGCACNPTAGRIVKTSNNTCGLQSRVTFNAIAGQQFLIEVGGTINNKGQGVLSISCAGQTPTNNDDCANAKSVGNVTDLPFDTTTATFDGPGHFMTSPNLWYLYTATCTCDVTVSLCGSAYDTKLAVYKGANCYPTAANLYASNDDSCGWQSEVTFAATAGQRYLIEVGGFGNKTGTGILNISTEGGGPQTPDELDLGDAPDSTNNHGRVMRAYYWNSIQANYPTVFHDGSGTGPYGPLHRHPRAVAYLGASVSHENEADIGSDQDGQNNIQPTTNTPNRDSHDNAITVPLNMPQCKWTTFDYNVKVVTPGTNLWVNVWCDWNRDGDWDDNDSTYTDFECAKGMVSEWAVQNQFLYNLPAGIHSITSKAFLPWHPVQGPEAIWMRITLSEKPWTGGSNPGVKGNGGSGPQGGYDVGETEDYYFIPTQNSSICEDYNGDGVVDYDDLSDFTTDWLQNCAP